MSISCFDLSTTPLVNELLLACSPEQQFVTSDTRQSLQRILSSILALLEKFMEISDSTSTLLTEMLQTQIKNRPFNDMTVQTDLLLDSLGPGYSSLLPQTEDKQCENKMFSNPIALPTK